MDGYPCYLQEKGAKPQEAELKERNQVLVEKEKLGICDIILALNQTGPGHLPWALQLQEPVLFPLHFNCFGWVFFFVMQRIQTNAEFSQSVVSSLSYDTRVSKSVRPVLSLCFQQKAPCLAPEMPPNHAYLMANVNGVLRSAALASPYPARLESAF